MKIIVKSYGQLKLMMKHFFFFFESCEEALNNCCHTTDYVELTTVKHSTLGEEGYSLTYLVAVENVKLN